jgi:hypothetical protein
VDRHQTLGKISYLCLQSRRVEVGQKSDKVNMEYRRETKAKSEPVTADSHRVAVLSLKQETLLSNSFQKIKLFRRPL